MYHWGVTSRLADRFNNSTTVYTSFENSSQKGLKMLTVTSLTVTGPWKALIIHPWKNRQVKSWQGHRMEQYAAASSVPESTGNKEFRDSGPAALNACHRQGEEENGPA